METTSNANFFLTKYINTKNVCRKHKGIQFNDLKKKTHFYRLNG